MNALFKPFVLAYCALRHRVLRRRYSRLEIERVDGVPFLVLPAVFNPVLLRTGEFMARVVESIPLAEAGARVLDMGTGSGVGAVFAARRGARVVAVDINPDAVRCARINALLNGVEERVEVRHGDLLEPLDPDRGDVFDLVLFNPPFYRGTPRDNIDFAWRGQDVLERFAAGLAGILAPGGRALIVFSDEGEWAALETALVANGFDVRALDEREYVNEVVTAFLVEPRAAESRDAAAAGRAGAAAGGAEENA